MKISRPVSVMPIECSNWAESERSRVTAVQPSSSTFTSARPMLIIGSTVKIMPGLSSGPVPGRPAWTTSGLSWKSAADAVAAEVAHNAVAVGLRVALDGVGDVAEVVAGLGLLEAEHQAFVGDVDQLARLQRHIADEVHAAGVAVPAVDDRGHVDVDDVAVLKRLLARNAVADDVIDRDAAALGVAAVAERRGHAAAFKRQLA